MNRTRSQPESIEVSFGALSPKPSEQVKGLPDKYDAWADSVTRLVIGGILTDAEAHKARGRLMKRIVSWVQNSKKASQP